MAVDSHTAVSIAQLVFYTPVVPITIYLAVRNWHNRPRTPWTTLVPFSLMRLVGSVVVIILTREPENIGLIIATIILLNVGLIPLIVSTIGLIRTVVHASLPDTVMYNTILRIIRFAFLAAIVLLVLGGAIIGTSPAAGRSLGAAGYIVFGAILLAVFGLLGRLFSRRADITSGDFIYVKLAMAAMPFLVVRTVYGLLYEFTSNNYMAYWDPLFGSAVAFALMALLPECVVLLMYLFLGFRRLRRGKVERIDWPSTEAVQG